MVFLHITTWLITDTNRYSVIQPKYNKGLKKTRKQRKKAVKTPESPVKLLNKPLAGQLLAITPISNLARNLIAVKKKPETVSSSRNQHTLYILPKYVRLSDFVYR